MSIAAKTIMYEAPEAASVKTVTGWVSASGRFWGNDEQMARFDGATHRLCEKNAAHGRHEIRSYCKQCRDERMQARFEAMPRQAWDMSTPVVIYDTDLYFFDPEALIDHMRDHDIGVADIALVLCEPQYPRPIDGGDHCGDLLPEDDEGTLPNALQLAFDALNKAIRECPPLSWIQGKVAIDLPSNFLDES